MRQLSIDIDTAQATFDLLLSRLLPPSLCFHCLVDNRFFKNTFFSSIFFHFPSLLCRSIWAVFIHNSKSQKSFDYLPTFVCWERKPGKANGKSMFENRNLEPEQLALHDCSNLLACSLLRDIGIYANTFCEERERDRRRDNDDADIFIRQNKLRLANMMMVGDIRLGNSAPFLSNRARSLASYAKCASQIYILHRV